MVLPGSHCHNTQVRDERDARERLSSEPQGADAL